MVSILVSAACGMAGGAAAVGLPNLSVCGLACTPLPRCVVSIAVMSRTVACQMLRCGGVWCVCCSCGGVSSVHPPLVVVVGGAIVDGGACVVVGGVVMEGR